MEAAAADEHTSYRAILKFILPTLGIWLAGPLMSLVDTGIVGQRSSLELAGARVNACDVQHEEQMLSCKSDEA